MSDDLRRIARLAGLLVSTDDIDNKLTEVERLLTHVARVQAVDTEGVEETFVFPPPEPDRPGGRPSATGVTSPHEATTNAEPPAPESEDVARLQALLVERRGAALRVPGPSAATGRSARPGPANR